MFTLVLPLHHFRPVICLGLLAFILPVSGCGAVVVGGVIAGTGSVIVSTGKIVTKGAVGAVKLTGRTAGAAANLVIGDDAPDADAE